MESSREPIPKDSENPYVLRFWNCLLIWHKEKQGSKEEKVLGGWWHPSSLSGLGLLGTLLEEKAQSGQTLGTLGEAVPAWNCSAERDPPAPFMVQLHLAISTGTQLLT